MTTDDPHDLAGAYAVDALDEEEREAFRRHCAGCPDCAREIARHQEVATWLGLAAAGTPPPGLRERVLAGAARTPQRPLALPVQADERLRRSSPPLLLRLALAASVAAAAALGGLAAWQHQEAQEARQVTGETRREAREAREARLEAQSQAAGLARLLAAPDTTVVKKGVAYGGSGTVVVSQALNQAAYFCQDLSHLRPGKTYQLWYVTAGNEVRSAGLVPSRAGIQVVALPPPGGAASLAITVEPSKGSPQPTTRPLATWPLPAS